MTKYIIAVCCIVVSMSSDLTGQRSDRRAKDKQQTHPRAYIELEDGSHLYGELLSDDNKEVELKILGDNYITLEHGYISDMMIEGEDIAFTKKGRYNINRGFYGNIMPYGFGANINGFSYSGQLALGYQLNQRLGVGIGSGLEAHSDIISGNWYDFASIPIYGHVRFNLNVNGPRVYALGKLGYSQALEQRWNQDEIKTSLFAQVGFGVAFPSRHIGRFVMELSRSHHLVNGTLFDWRDATLRQDFTKLLGRTTLKIGYSLGM